ncbi:hypothetical protein [Bartonella rattaustraliani]|uniref:hypothetical protein n=1 Tax=Bartonella rattaustraliani TaxID=481139 RepID=UPI000368788B|nr:hypothetical protein [Bartonella rattaustraliani]
MILEWSIGGGTLEVKSRGYAGGEIRQKAGGRAVMGKALWKSRWGRRGTKWKNTWQGVGEEGKPSYLLWKRWKVQALKEALHCRRSFQKNGARKMRNKGCQMKCWGKILERGVEGEALGKIFGWSVGGCGEIPGKILRWSTRGGVLDV